MGMHLYCLSLTKLYPVLIGPSPPYDVRAIPQGSTSMKVTWKKPLDPNGIIRKYTLEHCKRNCNSTMLLGNVTETVLSGLEADVNYTFKVIYSTFRIYETNLDLSIPALFQYSSAVLAAMYNLIFLLDSMVMSKIGRTCGVKRSLNFTQNGHFLIVVVLYGTILLKCASNNRPSFHFSKSH